MADLGVALGPAVDPWKVAELWQEISQDEAAGYSVFAGLLQRPSLVRLRFRGRGRRRTGSILPLQRGLGEAGLSTRAMRLKSRHIFILRASAHRDCCPF